MTPFQIGNRPVGPEEKPFIIAEMSGNHNNDLDRAMALVDAAAGAGADAVKLQTYTADTMTLDIREGAFKVEGGLWDGKALYDLYEEACTPWEWHAPIFERCKEKGILGFSSAFDLNSVDFLESLDVPAYKIASLELTDVELVARVAKTGKPMILSTGMASIAEIDESVQIARNNGCQNIVLLRCTSAYPSKSENANLATIPLLSAMFNCQAGLSDHTMGSHIPVAAVALGATVIEKHFTLRRADGGVDSSFSLEPEELARLCSETSDAAKAVGRPVFGGSKAEKVAMDHRRSLYIAQNLKAGDLLSSENLRSVRPGHGLPVKYRQHLIGAQVSRDVAKGTPMSWDLI